MAALPCVRPPVCPHCCATGRMVALPCLLEGLVLSYVSFSCGGRVDGLRIPNFWCTSCTKSLFALAKCVAPDGSPYSLAHVTAPTLREDEVLAFVFAAARVWPGSPARPEVVFDYDYFRILRAMQTQYVRVHCTAQPYTRSFPQRAWYGEDLCVRCPE